MLTKAAFLRRIEEHYTRKLIDGVIRQVGGWEYFSTNAYNISDNGAAGGVPGAVSNHEIAAFVKKYRAEILQYANEQAEACGIELGRMFMSFQCMEGVPFWEIFETLVGKPGHDMAARCLMYYAIEEACTTYIYHLELLEEQ